MGELRQSRPGSSARAPVLDAIVIVHAGERGGRFVASFRFPSIDETELLGLFAEPGRPRAVSSPLDRHVARGGALLMKRW
jgi:hypothetical protein